MTITGRILIMMMMMMMMMIVLVRTCGCLYNNDVRRSQFGSVDDGSAYRELYEYSRLVSVLTNLGLGGSRTCRRRKKSLLYLLWEIMLKRNQLICDEWLPEY